MKGRLSTPSLHPLTLSLQALVYFKPSTPSLHALSPRPGLHAHHHAAPHHAAPAEEPRRGGRGGGGGGCELVFVIDCPILLCSSLIQCPVACWIIISFAVHSLQHTWCEAPSLDLVSGFLGVWGHKWKNGIPSRCITIVSLGEILRRL